MKVVDWHAAMRVLSFEQQTQEDTDDLRLRATKKFCLLLQISQRPSTKTVYFFSEIRFARLKFVRPRYPFLEISKKHFVQLGDKFDRPKVQEELDDFICS